MNLENSIKDVIAKKLEDGTIEKVIAEELEKSIRKSLDDLFSYGGSAKKVIKEKIESVMVPYLENYDYSKYILKLDAVLVEILKNTALDNKKMLENFKSLVAYEKVKEIKTSDIFAKYMDYVAKEVDTSNLEVEYDDGVSYEYPEVSLEVEYDNERSWSDFKYATIVFECEKDEEMNIEIRISRFREYGWKLESNPIYNISSLRGLDTFSIFLMHLAQSHTSIIIDEDYAEEGVRPEAEPEPSWS